MEKLRIRYNSHCAYKSKIADCVIDDAWFVENTHIFEVDCIYINKNHYVGT